MNLFHNTNLVQAVREAFDLTGVQAICVLIAYQHGTVSTLSARTALGYDARTLSGTAALSMPVRKKVLKEVGKGRVKVGSRPATIYELVDPEKVQAVINQATDDSVALYRTIDSYEQTAKEVIHEDR